jgi:hypothetical protein
MVPPVTLTACCRRGVCDNSKQMACTEKQRLGAAYETGTRQFAEAVSELQQKMGVSSKTEYDRLSRAADEARVKSEQARLALEEHISMHRC